MAGWRHVKATQQRRKVEFAECMRKLVNLHFPHAGVIQVVVDNLNTHPSAGRHIGVILSQLQPVEMTPCRLTLPRVGFSPETPFTSQGAIMDPADSVPIEKPTHLAAMAEPGAADEPPAPVEGLQGLLVTPPNHRSPVANAPFETHCCQCG
jgi:hypothetical protein